MSKRKKFGEILVEAGVIKEVALRQALERQQITGWRLGKVLEAMGIIAEKDIAVALSHQYGFRTARDFARHDFPDELLNLVDVKRAKKFQAFPLKQEDNTLLLAMVNPLDLTAIDEIAAVARLRVIPVVTTSAEINKAIQRHYEHRGATPCQAMTVGGEPAKLLIVDSNPNSRIKLVNLFKSLGYLVEHAPSNTETIPLAATWMPHLVLVDTEPAEPIDPLQLLQQLPGLPFLAIGPNPVKEEVAFLEAGFVDFIHRPCHQDRLTARIKRALQLVHGDRNWQRSGSSPLSG